MSLKLLFNNVKAEPDKFFWVGYVPYDENGKDGYDEESDILNFNESLLNLCKEQGTVAEFDEENFPSTIDIELFGEGEYFFALVPEGYDFLIDTGLGSPVRISDTGEQFQMDAKPLDELIGGVQYYMYGFMQIIHGNRTFYLYAN